ncbi:TIGR02587 family membrane protein [Allocoleopsis franciscana]|uniref:Putative integral membrane protein TIGR02587 n=1 Tax=Allocoleopsis franciscana PCC 7113 TaxID=1173027 RepID=K9WFG9_9CYAN|nr:TIGR02587 family membrane protein [Allocoleopsis franciscana]AFZ18272.1 putative integral membrane protein TIGR02587 [Allocoleopsis franciscana PCC 7113]
MAKRTRKKRQSSHSWSYQLNDMIRGASGGFLFGIPLLYTMEVWWIGSETPPHLMLVILAITFIVVLLLNHTEGFRQIQSKRFLDTVMDSVEALAIGIVSATCILFVVGEITQETPLNEALGKLILESVPFSLGAALAGAFLSGDRWSSSNNQDSDQQGNRNHQGKKSNFNATLADIGGTLIGAMIIAFNIAPTDEIPMLDAAIEPPRLLAIIAVSLLISYGIVFQAGFTTQKQRRQQKGIFQRPISETVMSYLVSLFASAFMLFFFHRLSLDDPWTLWMSKTLILGLPATIGGAAGRLAI